MMRCAMKKIFALIPGILAFLLVIQAPGSAGNIDLTVKGSFDGDAPTGTRVHPVEDREAVRAPGISLPAVLTLDVLLPGGGHFYRGDYGSGFIFMSLKMAGVWSLYYFNARREEARADLQAARRSGAGEGRQELRYDRTAQLVTFSVIGNLMIYFVSAAVNYSRVMKVNENAFPSFDITGSLDGRHGIDSAVSVKFTLRI